MVTPIQISQNNSKLDKMKICNLQEENQLKVSTMELKDNLKTLNEKQICEHSELQCKLTEMHNEIINLKTECVRLLSELNNEQILCKKIETEYKELEEMTFRAVDKEVEHYKHVNQLHSKEVEELKTEIKQLKIELARAESNATTGATNNPTTKQAGAHQGVGSNARTTSAENNHPRQPSSGNSSQTGCQKSGSIVPHPPSKCPVRNFVCEGCQKKGHHTICLHSCRDCGARKAIHVYATYKYSVLPSPEQCILRCQRSLISCFLTTKIRSTSLLRLYSRINSTML